MFQQKSETGTPSVNLKWPKDAVIKTEIVKNEKGRFVCRVKVNDNEFFNLPSAHATEADAQLTLKHYIAENSHKE